MASLAPWLLLPLLASAHAEDARETCVPLVIEGLRSERGLLWVAAFDDAEAFEHTREDRVTTNLPVQGGRMETELCGLVGERVGVAVFHDENSNKNLDTVLSIPREGFGFSRNPSLWKGKPRFDEIALVLDGSPLVIELIYLF
jgi:uncharacterized protein (DUF2141 family)